MSKRFLLALANLNLFKNVNEEIEFNLSRDEKVQANYSAYDKAKGYDVRGVKAKSKPSNDFPNGQGFIRLSISVINDDGTRTFYNGALFTNRKKAQDKHPDFQGSISLDNTPDGEKLRLAAWKKTGDKAGDYLSISISEFQDRNTDNSQQGYDDGFDMDDTPPPRQQAPRQQAPAANRQPAARQQAPAARQPQRPAAPAPRQQAQAPARRPAPVAAGNGYDDQDSEIPF